MRGEQGGSRPIYNRGGGIEYGPVLGCEALGFCGFRGRDGKGEKERGEGRINMAEQRGEKRERR